MIMQRLRLLVSNIFETDRLERIENLRELADDYESEARALRAEITKIMSEPIIARMRADGAWDDAKDENEYRYLMNLAQQLEQHATRSFLLTRL